MRHFFLVSFIIPTQLKSPSRIRNEKNVKLPCKNRKCIHILLYKLVCLVDVAEKNNVNRFLGSQNKTLDWNKRNIWWVVLALSRQVT